MVFQEIPVTGSTQCRYESDFVWTYGAASMHSIVPADFDGCCQAGGSQRVTEFLIGWSAASGKPRQKISWWSSSLLCSTGTDSWFETPHRCRRSPQNIICAKLSIPVTRVAIIWPSSTLIYIEILIDELSLGLCPKIL